MGQEDHDALRQLREDLAAWLAQGQAMEQRLAALEAQAQAPAALSALPPVEAPDPVAPAAPAAPILPPPLPFHGQVKPVESAAPAARPVPGKEDMDDSAPGEFRRPMPFAPEGPGLDERVWAQLRKLGPKEDMSWEMALGSYWLPRAAVLVLGIGVVWLMGFAINRFSDAWWMPHVRIAIGAVLSVALLAWGKFEEAKRPAFARVLLSGGFGLSYFVVFATHFVPFSRIIPSPQPTLLMLSLLVAIWLALAQRRRSRLLALGVVALGHATVALSTLTLARPTPWAILGLLSLSAASGFFLARNRWFSVAAAGLVGSYLNHFFWLSKSPGSDAPLAFAIAMTILVAYGLIFALSEYLAPESLRRREVALRWRTAYVAANSSAVLLIGIGLMHSFSFSKPYLYVFYFLLAGALAAMGWAYRRKRAEDPLFGAYFTKASVVFTLGLATYFEGSSLTLSLALESIALLEAARRSGLLVTRLLALGTLGLTLLQGFSAASEATVFAHGAPGYLGEAVTAALTAAALLAFALRWQQAAWTGPDLALALGPKWFKEWLWSIDCGSLEPAPRAARPMAGLLMPEAAAVGGSLLGILQLFRLAHDFDTGPVASVAALLIALVAVLGRSRPLVHASCLWTAAGLLFWHLFAGELRFTSYASPAWGFDTLRALAVLLPLFLLSELSRCSAPVTWTLKPALAQIIPYLYAGLAVEVIPLACAGLVDPVHRATLQALVCCAALLYAALRGAAPLASFSVALAVIAVIAMAGVPLPLTHPVWQLAAALGLGIAAVGSDRQVAGERSGLCLIHDARGRYALYLVAACAATVVACTHARGDVAALVLMLVAIAAAAAMLRLSAQPICAAATLVSFAAALLWLKTDIDLGIERSHPMLWHVGSTALLLQLIGLDRWFSRRQPFRIAVPGATVVIAAWLIALYYSGYWFFQSNADFAWFVAGAAFVGYGLWVHGRTPIVLGILAAIAATAMLLARSFDDAHSAMELVLNFGIAITFWFAVERGTTGRIFVQGSLLAKGRPWLEGVLTALPCVLLTLWIERMPYLGAEYLSVGWTLGAVAMLIAGALTGQRFYRYAGLIVFALVLYRLIVIDSRGLDTVYRILGMIFLGLVLLGVAYGYLKARDRQK